MSERHFTVTRDTYAIPGGAIGSCVEVREDPEGRFSSLWNAFLAAKLMANWTATRSALDAIEQHVDETMAAER